MCLCKYTDGLMTCRTHKKTGASYPVIGEAMLIVVEAFLAVVGCAQCLFEEMPSVDLMPRVFNLKQAAIPHYSGTCS